MRKIKQVINSLDRHFDERPIFLEENYDTKLTGTDGRDVFQFSISASSLFIKAREGDDLVSGSGYADAIFTGSDNGADEVHGFNGNDFILTGGGNDDVRGGAGADYISAGRGNDRVRGESGDDIILGRAGNDRLDGGHGTDLLDGGPGDDDLVGGLGNDTLKGGSGNDVFLLSHDAIFGSSNSGTLDVVLDFTKGEDKVDAGLFTRTEVSTIDLDGDGRKDTTVISQNNGKHTLLLLGVGRGFGRDDFVQGNSFVTVDMDVDDLDISHLDIV